MCSRESGSISLYLPRSSTSVKSICLSNASKSAGRLGSSCGHTRARRAGGGDAPRRRPRRKWRRKASGGGRGGEGGGGGGAVRRRGVEKSHAPPPIVRRAGRGVRAGLAAWGWRGAGGGGRWGEAAVVRPAARLFFAALLRHHLHLLHLLALHLTVRPPHLARSRGARAWHEGEGEGEGASGAAAGEDKGEGHGAGRREGGGGGGAHRAARARAPLADE